MEIRRLFFKFILSKDLTIKIIDNFFNFSKINLEEYLNSMPYSRRITFKKESLKSIGVGYRKLDPLKNEKWLIEKFLFNVFEKNKNLVIFDIGANVGEYSEILHYQFPNSKIFSFEPNPKTYPVLLNNLKNLRGVIPYNFGFSATDKNATLYTYKDNVVSGHSSLLKEVFLDLYKTNSIVDFSVNLRSIDSFCEEIEIRKINFLKIDTEGFEFEILNGAKRMINSSSIPMIQFEFNEMNIVNRLFLKDFYKLLKDYIFYRIADGVLIDISNYQTEYEIFLYQDILCVLKSETEILNKISKYLLK